MSPIEPRNTIINKSYLIPGNCWPTELGVIYDSCYGRNSYTEVGVFCGRSLFVAALALGPNATITLVDDLSEYDSFPWPGYGQGILGLTLESIRSYRKDIKIIEIYKPSVQAAIEAGKSDVIYIDACHEYAECKADIEIWSKKLNNNGFLLGHDYCSRYPGVMDAVNEVCVDYETFLHTRIWMSSKFR
jgi:hypothetical protein